MQTTIIVIINKKPYTLCASDVEAIRNIPGADRQQLITLLEAVKRVENPVQPVTATVNTAPQTTAISTGAGGYQVSPERLRSGDVDAVMAQLIVEENLKQKPVLTKHSIHKWVGVVAVIIILLVLIF